MTTTVLNRLFKLGEAKGVKKGLENASLLDRALGYPSRAFLSVHIAGTNGKGSVTTKIAYALCTEKRKVGLYTSPHLCTFRERVVINGKMISEESAECLLERIFSAADTIGLSPTYFEMMTLLSFLYFAEEGVGIAALEVGMGGRWDATNVITPLLSVITSIDFDHTRYLGKTLEEIAYEKAGIIKPGIPVVVGPQAARIPIFSTIAQERGCPYFALEGSFDNFEEENRAIARLALQHLPFEEISEEGLLITPDCRFQIFQREVPIIVDVGHNPAAIRALFQRVEKSFPQKKYTALVAFSSDKEVGASLRELHKHVSHEVFLEKEAHLIVYNLGYLPRGAKSTTTSVEGTLRSLQHAMSILLPGGLISITTYSGHPEGEREEAAVIQLASSLPSFQWSTLHHRWLNRKKAPALLLMLKAPAP